MFAIERHLTEGARLCDVARDLGVSPRTLQRALAKHGTSFSESLASFRWIVVVNALINGDSVRRAGELAGYATTSHFCAAFKAFFGTTPGRFRIAARHQRLSLEAIHQPLVQAEAHGAIYDAVVDRMTPGGRDLVQFLIEDLENQVSNALTRE
jgi:AraC-like DNA-binding protein